MPGAGGGAGSLLLGHGEEEEEQGMGGDTEEHRDKSGTGVREGASGTFAPLCHAGIYCS